METHIFAEFWAILPKHWGNCAFSQNFYTRKLGEITVFYVKVLSSFLILNNYRTRKLIECGVDLKMYILKF